LLLLAGSVPCRSVRACMCAVHARAFLPWMIQLATHVTNQLLVAYIVWSPILNQQKTCIHSSYCAPLRMTWR
jgi:hypothetical protein